MNQTIIAIAILLSILVSIFSNEYFEDKILGQNKKVLGISKEERFFLPLPKDFKIISTNSDQRNTNLIVEATKNATELRDFYKEILRSKGYENDYEYEKDNVSELRYIKESEDLKITVTQEGENTILEFNHHK